MAYIIPENTTRLTAKAFVDSAELSRVGGSEIIRHETRELAEQALRKLMDDCITTEEYEGRHIIHALSLYVYVLAPHELHKIIEEAKRSGQEDALGFMPSYDYS